MNDVPFGLPPIVFSIIMVVGWLTIAPLVAWFFMRKRRYVGYGAPAQPAAPPVYPAMAGPGPQYPELVGTWRFKSALRWLPVWFGVVAGMIIVQLPLMTALAAGAVVLLVIGFFVWRPTLAVQHLTVDNRLAITLSRGGRDISFDLNHFRYVRMQSMTSRGYSYPSMLVLSRDSRPGVVALLGSRLFPRVDDQRVVFYYNRWWTAEGALIPPTIVDELIRDVCARAGHPPQPRGRGSWEVAQQW
jgi:hypothetical protein